MGCFVTQVYPGYNLLPLTVIKSILGQLDHHLLCFDELCVLFLSPWLSQGFQKKRQSKSTTVETLGVRQDNLLG